MRTQGGICGEYACSCESRSGNGAEGVVGKSGHLGIRSGEQESTPGQRRRRHRTAKRINVCKPTRAHERTMTRRIRAHTSTHCLHGVHGRV